MFKHNGVTKSRLDEYNALKVEFTDPVVWSKRETDYPEWFAPFYIHSVHQPFGLVHCQIFNHADRGPDLGFCGISHFFCAYRHTCMVCDDMFHGAFSRNHETNDYTCSFLRELQNELAVRGLSLDSLSGGDKVRICQ